MRKSWDEANIVHTLALLTMSILSPSLCSIVSSPNSSGRSKYLHIQQEVEYSCTLVYYNLLIPVYYMCSGNFQSQEKQDTFCSPKHAGCGTSENGFHMYVSQTVQGSVRMCGGRGQLTHFKLEVVTSSKSSLSLKRVM